MLTADLPMPWPKAAPPDFARPAGLPAQIPQPIPGWDNLAEWTGTPAETRGRLSMLHNRAMRHALRSRFGADLLLIFAEALEEAGGIFGASRPDEAKPFLEIATLARMNAAELAPSRPGAGA